MWGKAPGEGGDVIERVLSYWAPMVPIRPQFVGVLATARAACSDFAESHVARSVYFGCEPGARDVGTRACDFAEAVGPDGGARVLLFQPSRDGLDTLVTRVLKALFFEAVFSDPIRASGGPDLPLVAYVADEFHQFVTSDRVHGEANFVDTCRSYGVFCVLACQSVSSIENAFAHSGGSEVQDTTAVSILWNNTGSKFSFARPTLAPRAVSRSCARTARALRRSRRYAPCPPFHPGNATRSSPTGASSAASSSPSCLAPWSVGRRCAWCLRNRTCSRECGGPCAALAHDPFPPHTVFNGRLAMSADLQSDPLGHCRWCGAEVAADSFRDLESLREYQMGRHARVARTRCTSGWVTKIRPSRTRSATG